MAGMIIGVLKNETLWIGVLQGVIVGIILAVIFWIFDVVVNAIQKP